MPISDKKQRYSVTLTPMVVNRFYALAKDVGLPTATISNICEDALKQTILLFQIAKDKGSFDVVDLHRLVGQQMELAIEEEINERSNPDEKAKSKTKKPVSKKPVHKLS